MKNFEFERRIKNNQKPIIVDIWAPWCVPCQAMAPAFKQTSHKYNGRVDVLKINADESPDVLKELGVMSIPTLIGFAKGAEIYRRSGMQTQSMLDFFFETTVNQMKPVISPPAPATRVIRTILGITVIAIGWWFMDHSILVMAIGGLVIFSGFYDRCPIFRALALRVKSLFQKAS
jgi:thioredoxin